MSGSLSPAIVVDLAKAVRCKARSKAEGPRFDSASTLLFLQKVCVMDSVTLPRTSNDTSEWLTPLFTFMQAKIILVVTV